MVSPTQPVHDLLEDGGWMWRSRAGEGDRDPCCMVTEGEWTWFGSTLLITFLVAVFNLKYYRKVVGRPHNLLKEENEKVLKEYLFAQQKGMGCSLPTSSIPIQQFQAAAQEREKHPFLYKLEFTAGSGHDEEMQSSVARQPENVALNRNPELLPYDHTLVKVPGVPYINASHVSGDNGMDYIVTQGPLDTTVSDFWRLVWEKDVPVIAMLTKTFDFIKVMCVEYWPAVDREERYGGLYARTLSETKFANYVERRIQLRPADTDAMEVQTFKTVVQIQYTEWASHGMPVKETLLDFRTRVGKVHSENPDKPCLVHCTDGGGRSGVFLFLDYNIRLIEREDEVDIYNKFTRLRRERMGLVSEENQYRLIYLLLTRYLQAGPQVRSVEELASLDLDAPATSKWIQAEYEVVSGLVPRLGQGECAGAHREDNRGKNRDHSIVPPDAHRPYISSFQGNSCTDYINAVFVDGFLKSQELLATEWPMVHTIPDFWSMVYDHEVSCVVVLGREKARSFPVFWPDPDHNVNFGPVFSVDRVADIEKRIGGISNGLQHREFNSFPLQIRRKEVDAHKKFQSGLSGEGRPLPSLSTLVAGVSAQPPPRSVRLYTAHHCPAGILSLVRAVHAETRTATVAAGPICIVSADGVSRIGVYALLSYAMDQLGREQHLNVLQAATTIKRHRPQLLKSVSEYNQFYQLVTQLAKAE